MTRRRTADHPSPRVGGVVTAGVAVLVAGGLILAVSGGAQAATAVGLGTADSFAVLAGTGITNTGATTITGDIGSFPTTTIGLTGITFSGTNHAGDAVTQGAKSDLVTAYNSAAGQASNGTLPVELGGTTLVPGVYTGGTFGITGTLTLDAQGDPNAVFVFQVGTTLITAASSTVSLINGAQACNVFWQVGSSATLTTDTVFVGTIMAMTSISLQTRATVDGRVLARDGAVTMDTNTITRSVCLTSVPTTPPASETPAPTAITPPPAASAAPTAAPAPTVAPIATPTATPAPTATQAPVSTPPRRPSGTAQVPVPPGGGVDTGDSTVG